MKIYRIMNVDGSFPSQRVHPSKLGSINWFNFEGSNGQFYEQEDYVVVSCECNVWEREK